MAVYERCSGPHVAERVQPAPGSAEAARLQGLADDAGSDWRRVAVPEPPEDTGPPTEDPPAAPTKSAAKPDWVAYAVAQGAEQSDAEAMTKDQLIEAYAPAD